jgi:radical SAM/Cys-rich protein
MGLTLFSRQDPLASSQQQLNRLAAAKAYPPFEEKLATAGIQPLHATGITVFQINVGKFCNQSCRHCHVDAGPERTEQMTRETAELCIRVLSRTDIPTVDITGGAPELNPNFRWLVEQASALGRHVIDRCNLTVLLLKPQAGLAEFLASNRVEVMASLPYFLSSQTDAQRGDGVFERSILAMQMLNRLGYGVEGSGLALNLVHNPVGAFLPAKQDAAEAQFRRELLRRHGVTFNHLYTITNMPISRFLDFLIESGNYEGYMERLANAFNPAAAAGVMCRYTLSVGWEGTLYDCDFNQMLDLPLGNGAPRHIRDFDTAKLNTRRIITANHCYGCTAGSGSSCGGAVT